MNERDIDQAPVIDVDYMCRYISKNAGIDSKIVENILWYEMEFLEGKGGIGEVGEENNEVIYIDEQELFNFISEKAKVNEFLVEKVIEVENRYLSQNNI
ncbi:hypothetical protein FHP05_00160 [Cerasibacillus terrae]|uniref:Uncharacterized protein n=1 Tax=Cerasibacillus terrae TaxID=2498845 RepID=A0A5C8P1S3_9BACI|nr:hypothetical protein [Cerasibacillus terrae]TXL67471.1 hypothetical protein FHP05_00160 [Cerasibacillus terrae]